MDTGTWGLYYNYTWWGNAIQTAPSVIGKPDFFGSQFEMLTSQQPNQVVNGDFATNSDWDFFGESEFTTQGARIFSSSGAYSAVNQNNVLTVGKQYKVMFDVISTNGSNLANGSGTITYDTSTTGNKTFYITADETIFQLKRFSGATDVTVDNISAQIVRADNVEAVKCLADWIHETQILDV